jgi:TP901-1 family phage major tail protein
MKALKGIDILIKAGGEAIALQKGATLNRSAETFDTTTKTSGGWKEFVSSLKEWSVDCDGLYTLPKATGTSSFRILEDAFTSGTALTIEFALASDSASGIGDTTGFTGQAIIVDFPLEAPQDDSLSFSVSLQGTGALVEIVKQAKKSKEA